MDGENAISNNDDSNVDNSSVTAKRIEISKIIDISGRSKNTNKSLAVARTRDYPIDIEQLPHDPSNDEAVWRAGIKGAKVSVCDVYPISYY